MTEQVTYYKPSSGDKLVIKVMKREKNTCGQLAYSLYRIASRECPQPGLEGEPFRPNWVYEFANGLVFRLFDDGLDPEGQVLEFYVPEPFQRRATEVLARVPRLLQTAGVGEEALLAIKRIFPSPSARLMHTAGAADSRKSRKNRGRRSFWTSLRTPGCPKSRSATLAVAEKLSSAPTFRR
jgi:hypothetical protein